MAPLGCGSRNDGRAAAPRAGAPAADGCGAESLDRAGGGGGGGGTTGAAAAGSLADGALLGAAGASPTAAGNVTAGAEAGAVGAAALGTAAAGPPDAGLACGVAGVGVAGALAAAPRAGAAGAAGGGGGGGACVGVFPEAAGAGAACAARFALGARHSKKDKRLSDRIHSPEARPVLKRRAPATKTRIITSNNPHAPGFRPAAHGGNPHLSGERSVACVFFQPRARTLPP